MKITLPKPPSINSLYSYNFRNRTKFVSQKGLDWFNEAGRLIKQGKDFEGEVSLYVTVYYAGRFDYDNGLKCIGDLLMKQYWIKDDDQIMFAQISKVRVPTRKEQKVLVEVPEL